MQPLPPTSPLTNGEARFNAHRQNQWGEWNRTLLELAVLVSCVGGILVGYYHSTRSPFDSTRWKAATGYENLPTRERMCYDLLHNKRLIGLTHPQVIALLGKPDAYHVMDYHMGYEVSHASVDPTLLLINFDKHKRVCACILQTGD